MSWFRKTKNEYSEIEPLIDGAKQFLKEHYLDGQKSTEKEKQGIPSADYVRSSSDNVFIQFSERDSQSFSERDEYLRRMEQRDKYDARGIDKTLNGFLMGNMDPSVSGSLAQKLNSSFVPALLQYIEMKELKDADLYKAAGIDRRLYSKMISDYNYKPSKSTCLALAIALKLDLDEVNELIGRAGYTLSHSIKKDVVIEYCIRQREYSLIHINELLRRLDMDPLSNA